MPGPPIIREFLGACAVIASEPMRRLFEQAERVARSHASVLICGESGSGKEIVARAIHQLSLQSNGPWVDVNCGAFPENLIESELFGYDKGAFSGANMTKPGLFELADKGTLFLDEIGELEPRMQVKLLRVLDGAPYYRLGGLKKISVNVRVVAATNRDLEQGVDAGTFRKDLLHRLDQIRLTVPPLRERRADIVPLAERFLEQQNPDLRMRDEVVMALESYPWPGNIRELRNVITAAAVFASGAIRLQDLPEKVLALQPPMEVNGSKCGASATSLEDVERDMILHTLTKTGGHQQKAAELLGISRRTLSRKLKLYELEEETA